MSLKQTAFHVCRAQEALEDSRNGDDDVEQARQQHLFGAVEAFARVPYPSDLTAYQAAATYLRLALCQYLRGKTAEALAAVQKVRDNALIAPHTKLAA